MPEEWPKKRNNFISIVCHHMLVPRTDDLDDDKDVILGLCILYFPDYN